MHRSRHTLTHTNSSAIRVTVNRGISRAQRDLHSASVYAQLRQLKTNYRTRHGTRRASHTQINPIFYFPPRLIEILSTAPMIWKILIINCYIFFRRPAARDFCSRLIIQDFKSTNKRASSFVRLHSRKNKTWFTSRNLSGLSYLAIIPFHLHISLSNLSYLIMPRLITVSSP